jgi:hypothetical protein
LASASETQVTPEQLLNLLLMTDALRQKDRFDTIVRTFSYLQPAWANLLRTAQQKVLTVDPQKVLVPGLKGPEIQERIRAARLTALVA